MKRVQAVHWHRHVASYIVLTGEQCGKHWQVQKWCQLLTFSWIFSNGLSHDWNELKPHWCHFPTNPISFPNISSLPPVLFCLLNNLPLLTSFYIISPTSLSWFLLLFHHFSHSPLSFHLSCYRKISPNHSFLYLVHFSQPEQQSANYTTIEIWAKKTLSLRSWMGLLPWSSLGGVGVSLLVVGCLHSIKEDGANESSGMTASSVKGLSSITF